MSEININGFSGMNNLNSGFSDKDGVAIPRFILNADVDASGKATKRDGLTAHLVLVNAHSLWACEECMVCVAGGYLYDLSSGSAVEIGTIGGPEDEFLSYALFEGKVYVSNQYWSGAYDPIAKSIVEWGINLPVSPVLVSDDGNLPVGTYHVTLTTVSSGEISGNGPIATITLSTVGGIRLIGRVADTLVWATDQNGYTFSLVGDTDIITHIPTVEPLPSFMCSPPPNITCLSVGLGRIWGADGDELRYSEPHQPGWFKITSNRFRFNSPITIIAPISTGVFVGMEDRTVFLLGTEPDQMRQIAAGAGSILGTLAYANNLPELGDILGTPEKGFVDVPVWRTTEGIVAGNVTGKLYNLTKHKMKMGSPERGASLYRQKDGEFQFITSGEAGVTGSGTGGYDAALATAIEAGRMAINNLLQSANSSLGRMSEDVTCEQRRGGVLI